MKKNLFLTLMLALLFTASAWAQFAPETGKKYALRETTTGMYLDIQTLGIKDGTTETNNISLNTKPCIIYFEAGSTDGQWKLKNVNGGYLYHLDDDGWGQIWNPQIGTKGEVKEWVITETEANVITIARAEGNYLFKLNYIYADNLTPASPLYCSSETGLKFELVDYAATGCDKFIYTLQSPMGTYLQLDMLMENADTRTKFSGVKHYFNLSKDGNGYKIENRGNYIAYNVLQDAWGNVNTWGTGANDGSTENAVWLVSEFDDDGFVHISHIDPWNNEVYLGSSVSTAPGGYIYAHYGENCNRWYIEGTTDYPTDAILSDGKYTFTSGIISYSFPCNKLRFTLIESTAQYENTAFNRCDFESFVLLDKDGNTIADADDFNWNTDASAHDWFEIDLGNENLGGEFAFSFVTANDQMNAKAFRIDAYYRSDVYKLVVDKQGLFEDEVTVTYNGGAAQSEYPLSAINTELFEATEIHGYTWSVVIDRTAKQIIIRYSSATIVDDELDAVDDLVDRIGGQGTAGKFKFVLDPSMNSASEVFEIGKEDGKILIKGTTISAITTGIGWYLQNYAHINISWNSLNERAAGEAYVANIALPLPTATETRTCDAKYRYFLNYCTFGYSMSTWTWKRWQQEIDWMALHGINMPLQIVGLEEVWRTFLTMKNENGAYKYGYDEEDAKNFVAGPAFTAWWGMNNLEGWGGTQAGVLNNGYWDGAGGVQDDAWYARQKELAKQILERQRDLGMEPVLPGFSGMVPHDFQNESGYTTRENGGYWAGGFLRPMILSVENTDYAAIAADYYECLEKVMGKSKYYSMDPFHEGGGAGTINDYAALYNAMEAANGGSQWVIQQWQWNQSQRLALTAVPAGRLIVLDLFSDGRPAFDAYSGYAPHEAVFCAIPNFGGRSGLMGRLNNLTDNYFNYKATYPSIKGIGAAPEAIEQTPVTYDLLFQLPWMGGKPDVAEWVRRYSTARYGVENAELQAAWELLRQGPLNYGADGIQGPVEDVWAARPNLDAKAASSWGSTLSRGYNIPAAPENTYTKERQQMLIQATYKLLSQNSAVSGAVNQSNYNYDVVELGGAVMADYAHYLLLGIKEAKEAAGEAFATDAVYIARRDAFLALIEEVDAFKGTNLNFRLGKWTQEARAAAAEIENAKTATADWYEYNNARTIITTWSSPGTDLNDYSYRSWQGMMKDYYLPRWQAYFNSGCNDNLEYGFFEWNWAHGLVHAVGQTAVSKDRLVEGQPGYSYSATPVGNAVELANGLLAKYMIPVSDGYGTYYAHRHIANDLTSIVTIYTKKGETINLAPYFGELSGATVTGDFIEGEVTSLNSVPVKSTATDDSYTGTVKLADGTSFTFIVSLEPAYNGVYRLKAMTCGDGGAQPLTNPGNLFIAYNNDATDLFGSVGYKLMANGTYSSSAVADEYFTIAPLGNGYSLQAQGLYVKAPQDLASWGHIMCSENSIDAGVYLFDEVDGENLVVLHNDTGDNIWANSYLNVWDKNILGNESSSRYSKFAIEQVTTYPLTFPANGEAVVCLPFNIVLPEGVVAYDVIDVDDAGRYEIALLAASGEKVMAGTPVILRGEKGAACELGVTVDNSGAKGALTGSLLRGNFIKQQLNVDNAISKYTFNAENASFNLLAASTEIAGNSVWMELDRRIESPVTRNYKGYLAEMIEKMQALTDVLIVYNRDENELSLQTNSEEEPYYIWCNAINKGSSIDNLLDGNTATYLHTNWQNTSAPSDGLDHHLTVKLGEGNELTYFVFDYKTRAQVDGEGELGDYPTIIKVQGSNDGENYVDIAIVNPHNASGQAIKNGAGWTSGMLGNGQSYKYLRFMVTATTTNKKKDGHIYWHMAEFNLYKMVPTGDVRPYLASGGLTSEHIRRAKEALAEAEKVYVKGTTDSDFDTAAENLEQEYNVLLALLKNVLPVELTIDEANPRLYKIIIKRADKNSKVLSFDEPTSDKVKVVDNGANKSYQAWYFMPGENGILIKPFNGNGKVLSVDNKDDGQSKANIAAADIYKFQEWGFTRSTLSGCTDYFYIKLVGDGSAGTFSHNGGFSATSYMGILSRGFNTSDGGSLFKFIDAEFSNENARYYQLSDVVDTMLEPKSDPGYPSEGYDEYAEAYTTAKALQYSGNANSSASCYEAYVELQTAYHTWKSATGDIFKPVHGAVYRIRNYVKSVGDGASKNHYLAVDGAQMIFSTVASASGVNDMWVCLKYGENDYRFVSALGTLAFGWECGAENPQSYQITTGTDNMFGAVTFVGNSVAGSNNLSLTNHLYQGRGAVQFDHSSVKKQATNWSTDWYLETVKDANVVFERTIPAGHHWGTLYLPYAVEVPANLTAYYANSVDATNKVVNLQEVDNVIPAYTAVIVNRADDNATETFSFKQTAKTGTAVNGNKFAGRIIASAVGGANDTNNYYLLLNAGKGEAFYWVYKECDGTGEITTPGSHDGGYIKCDANKAYLAVPSTATSAGALSFRFGGDTTEIDEVIGESGEVKAIYDLQGRKVVNPKEGLYIVDGKKVFIK